MRALLCLSFFALPAHAELKVVATLPDLGALATEIGGAHVAVTVLASPEEDPHYVDPRPSFILALNAADLVVINGLGIEAAWLSPLLTQARNSRILPGAAGYLDASSVVHTLEVRGRVDRAEGDIHPGGNPHYLFDPRAGIHVAGLIGERLASLDAAHATEYRARTQALQARLVKLVAQQQARFATLPASNRRLVVYHASLVYLWDWLGITQIQTVEPKPGIPPNPGHTATVLKVMKAQGVKVIAQEAFYPARVSKTLARLLGGKVVLLAGGADVRKGQTYAQRIEAMADALHAALR